MATIIAQSRWPTSSSEKLAKTWLEMGDVPDTQKLIWAGTLDPLFREHFYETQIIQQVMKTHANM